MLQKKKKIGLCNSWNQEFKVLSSIVYLFPYEVLAYLEYQTVNDYPVVREICMKDQQHLRSVLVLLFSLCCSVRAIPLAVRQSFWNGSVFKCDDLLLLYLNYVCVIQHSLCDRTDLMLKLLA